MRYAYEGSNGGYIIEDDPPDEQQVLCELCGERCTDDFVLHPVSSCVSICLCRYCSGQDGREIDELYLFTKPNHNHIKS